MIWTRSKLARKASASFIDSTAYKDAAAVRLFLQRSAKELPPVKDLVRLDGMHYPCPKTRGTQVE